MIQRVYDDINLENAPPVLFGAQDANENSDNDRYCIGDWEEEAKEDKKEEEDGKDEKEEKDT